MVLNEHTSLLGAGTGVEAPPPEGCIWKSRRKEKSVYVFCDIEPLPDRPLLEDAPDASSLVDCLKGLSDFSEIMLASKMKFPETKKDILQRIGYLYRLFESEEGEALSLESLKGVLVFLYSIRGIRKPTITLSDSGFFHLSWKKSKESALSLLFKEEFSLHYVLFMPSRSPDRRVILNGSMDLFDFKNYLSRLGVVLHLEER